MHLKSKNLREAQENFACFGLFQGLTEHFYLSQYIYTKVFCEIRNFQNVPSSVPLPAFHGFPSLLLNNTCWELGVDE